MKKILIMLTAVLLFTVCLFSCTEKDKENGSENEIAVENNTDAEDAAEVAETEENVETEEIVEAEETIADGGAESETDEKADASQENIPEAAEDEISDSDNKPSEEQSENKAAEEESEEVSEEKTEESEISAGEEVAESDENIPEDVSESSTEEKTEDEAADEEEAGVTCTAVWVSSEASLDGERLDPETDGMMEMQLALFDDGEYIMAAYVDNEMMENYPQQDKYTIENGVLELASGWLGEINGDKMDLSYSDGTNTVTFHCALAASAE